MKAVIEHLGKALDGILLIYLLFCLFFLSYDVLQV